MCLFSPSGCLVKPRRPAGRRGLPHDSPRAQTCTFDRPGLQKHHQNSTRRPPRERRKKEISGGREKKKERNFGRSRGRAVRRRGVRERCPQILNPPHTQTTTTTTPTSTNKHQQVPTGTNKHLQATTRNNNNNSNRKFGQNTKTRKLAKCGLAKCGQHLKTPILAKCGLTKCGHENKLAKFGFFWPNAVLAKCGLAKCGHDRLCHASTKSGPFLLGLLADPHHLDAQWWVPRGGKSTPVPVVGLTSGVTDLDPLGRLKDRLFFRKGHGRLWPNRLLPNRLWPIF